MGKNETSYIGLHQDYRSPPTNLNILQVKYQMVQPLRRSQQHRLGQLVRNLAAGDLIAH